MHNHLKGLMQYQKSLDVAIPEALKRTSGSRKVRMEATKTQSLTHVMCDVCKKGGQSLCSCGCHLELFFILGQTFLFSTL